MSRGTIIYREGRIFDGKTLHDQCFLELSNGIVERIGPANEAPDRTDAIDLQGDILAPGFVDLQVNGGDGIMFNDDLSADALGRIAKAHRRLGATSILPTLITDTPENTRAAISAATEAVAAGVPGIAGLHLEGPHLSVRRKGAHDEKLIRKMTDEDLAIHIGAARSLPRLMVTVAPENVTTEQVRRLTDAGALVSLGHTDADFETCMRYAASGARAVTHLFNAMSQLGNREPGLVGAALHSGGLSAGLIADAIHVHPAAIRAAWAAKQGPGRIYLVSDAMACAGTDTRSFLLGGRIVTRTDGRLTLEDGTLAGADLDLGTALRVLVEEVGVTLTDALKAATSIPADLAGLPDDKGYLRPGRRADLIRIAKDYSVSPA
jgi:N-acetylglucosamine-6-phosphate deacetylase